MSAPQPAYLIVHKLALFNDEWYDDYALTIGAANPVSLHTSRAEAEADILARTRKLMRGSSFDDLQLDRPEALNLERAMAQPGLFDPALSRDLQLFLETRNHPLPTTLTDAQLDAILAVSGLKMFHILEAELDDFDLTLAQTMLALTPERPNVDLEFYYDEEHESEPDYQPEVVLEKTDDPAAQRLNRVTALFGRQYTNGIAI